MAKLKAKRIKKSRLLKQYFKRRFLYRKKDSGDDFISIHLQSSKWDGSTLSVSLQGEATLWFWDLHKKRPRKRALKSLRRLSSAINGVIEHLEAEDKRLS